MSEAESRLSQGPRLLLSVEPIQVFSTRKRTGDGGTDSNDNRPDSPNHVAQARTVERPPYAPR